MEQCTDDFFVRQSLVNIPILFFVTLHESIPMSVYLEEDKNSSSLNVIDSTQDELA